jgi:hypothetical protein
MVILQNGLPTHTPHPIGDTGQSLYRHNSPIADFNIKLHPWGESPERGNVTEVTLRPIKSSPTRIAALISNEIQFVNDPQPQDVPRMRSSPGVKITEGQEARVQFLAFDQHRDDLLYSNVKGKNPWKDLRVRQAVAHAIDAEAIRTKVRDFVENHIKPAVEPFGHRDEMDPEKHRQYVGELIRLRKLAVKEGLWLPHMPKEWGGMGLGHVALAMVQAEAAKTRVGPWVFNCQAPDEGNMHTLVPCATR